MTSKLRRERFEVLLEPEDEGGYHVWCPRLPGCHSEGETRAEALANIKEAIEGWLEVAEEFNHPVPEHEIVEVVTPVSAKSA
jgi:predicted RNase H-like HicB family nuclease